MEPASHSLGLSSVQLDEQQLEGRQLLKQVQRPHAGALPEDCGWARREKQTEAQWGWRYNRGLGPLRDLEIKIKIKIVCILIGFDFELSKEAKVYPICMAKSWEVQPCLEVTWLEAGRFLSKRKGGLLSGPSSAGRWGAQSALLNAGVPVFLMDSGIILTWFNAKGRQAWMCEAWRCLQFPPTVSKGQIPPPRANSQVCSSHMAALQLLCSLMFPQCHTAGHY